MKISGPDNISVGAAYSRKLSEKNGFGFKTSCIKSGELAIISRFVCSFGFEMGGIF
jgi:hypothetical protein